MRSVGEDRTSRAIIRDEALRLFAERGADAVSVRDIASAAGVSPALVIRHFGSKAGLGTAVDEHVAGTLQAMLAPVLDGPRPLEPAALTGLVGQVRANLPAESPVPRYLARVLLDGGPAGRALFRRLHELSLSALTGLVSAGRADDGGDPAVRAAFLLANDLAVLMLRPVLADVLGFDPFAPDGMHRWARQVLTVYDGGLLARASEAGAAPSEPPARSADANHAESRKP